MASLVEHMSSLPDPRIDRTKKHSLRDILVLSILAVVCGADSIVDIEHFGKAKEAWLRKTIGLPNGIPSHDTIGRVLAQLSPTAFAERFNAWVGDVAELVEGEVIAVDGKTVRRSMDRAGARGPIHLVSAWATQCRLVLGQVKTAEKSNEITAIPELLDVLNIAGCIVTIDAMGCQRAIAQKIVDRGGNYMLMLKTNHPALHAEVEQFFHDGIATDFEGFESSSVEQAESKHARNEVRRIWTCSDIDWLPMRTDWPGLASLVCVEAERTPAGKATSLSRRYYLSSLPDISAVQAAAIIRAHWSIENQLHWVLDVAFREDESRVRMRNAAENFGFIRKLALNLIKRESSLKVGVKAKRLRAGWDTAYLRKILAD